MNRWTTSSLDSPVRPIADPDYENVRSLRSELHRISSDIQSTPAEAEKQRKLNLQQQLLKHQELLESALADLELSGKSAEPDINGNKYYAAGAIPLSHSSAQSAPSGRQTTPLVAAQPKVPPPGDVGSIYANLSFRANGNNRRAHPHATPHRPQQEATPAAHQNYRYLPTANQQSFINLNPPPTAAPPLAGSRSAHSALGTLPTTLDQTDSIYANLPPKAQQHSLPKSHTLHRSKPPSDQVDHLTDLLVKSMESNEPDFFGMCNKCGEKVVGEGNGCTAMEMVYHIQCFTCTDCQKELRGKSFYALENNPFCEDCYLNTLEKCCVCEKPILDRILRATGKPYHPSCFTCVVCRKSLDGIPFTVDASNQVHCIDCFHEKFAPRCSVCKAPIVPQPGKTETVRVVALDRSFHVECYKCEDCDLLLSSEAEGRGCYPLDDHILCRNCNAKRVQAMTA